ncbi:MAG: hypothetical protein P8Z78_03600 [Gammaproteobacteria bacterium]
MHQAAPCHARGCLESDGNAVGRAIHPQGLPGLLKQKPLFPYFLSEYNPKLFDEVEEGTIKKHSLFFTLLMLVAITIPMPAANAAVLVARDCNVNARIMKVSTGADGVLIEGGITNSASSVCQCVDIRIQVYTLSSRSDRTGTPVGVTNARVTGLSPRIEKKFRAKLSGRPGGIAKANILSLTKCSAPARPARPARPAAPPPPPSRSTGTPAQCHLSGLLLAETFDPEYVDMQGGVYGAKKRAHLSEIYLYDPDRGSASRRTSPLRNAAPDKRQFTFRNLELGKTYELSLPAGWNFQSGQQTRVKCTHPDKTTRTPDLRVSFTSGG